MSTPQHEKTLELLTRTVIDFLKAIRPANGVEAASIGNTFTPAAVEETARRKVAAADRQPRFSLSGDALALTARMREYRLSEDADSLSE